MNLENAKRKRAAALMAEGRHTGRAIANAVQVREETLSRWKADPDFQALVQAALDTKARGALEDRLAALAPDSLDVLGAAMKETTQYGRPTATATQAAGLILRAALLNPQPTIIHHPKEPLSHGQTTQNEESDL